MLRTCSFDPGSVVPKKCPARLDMIPARDGRHRTCGARENAFDAYRQHDTRIDFEDEGRFRQRGSSAGRHRGHSTL